MASVTYLGRHVPSGLRFLLEESLLPKDHSPDSYKWHSYINDGANGGGDDELLATENCVVWSSNGILKRLFRFRHDTRKVLDAVLTSFESDGSKLKWEDALTPKASEISGNEAASSAVKINTGGLQTTSRKNKVEGNSSSKVLERALVIVLEHEARVYFNGGAQHIITLPFEVERVFPILQGVVFQRKSLDITPYASSPVSIKAPHNTFRSSQDLPGTGKSHTNISTSNNVNTPLYSSTPALQLSEFGLSITPLAEDPLPRLFTLTDPLSTIKPILTSIPSSKSQYYSSGHQVDGEFTDEIDEDEELLYVSSKDEMEGFALEGSKPLMLALTVNRVKGTLAIWKVIPKIEKSRNTRHTSNPTNLKIPKNTRRSSHGTRTSTGVHTPLLRNPSGVRDRSFNGQPSFVAAQDLEGPESEILNLGLGKNEQANRADPSSGTVVSSQRSVANRRTSSIVARAELPAPDQPLFSEFSRNPSTLRGSHGGNARKSGNPNVLGERASFGHTRVSGRFSTSASVDRLSDVEEQSFQDYSSDEQLLAFRHRPLTDDQNSQQELDSDDMMLDFKLVWMAPILDLGLFSIFDPGKSLNGTKVQLVTSVNSGAKKGRYHWLTSIFITHKLSQSMVQICVRVKQEEMGGKFHENDKRPKNARQSIWVPSRYVQLQFHKNIIDSLKIQDGSLCRLLMLQRRSTGIELGVMADLGIDDSGGVDASTLDPDATYIPGYVRLDDSKWKLWDSPSMANVTELSMTESSGKLNIIVEKEHHQIQVRLIPTNEYVGKMLDACSFVLSGVTSLRSSLLCIWWQLCQKFKHSSSITDRNAFVAAIFCFVLQNQPLPIKLTQKLSQIQLDSHLSSRTSSDKYTHLHHVANESKAWEWACQDILKDPKSPYFAGNEKNNFLLFGISLAMEQIQLIRGTGPKQSESMAGSVRQIVPRLLVVLHLMREEEKLNIASPEMCDARNSSMVGVLGQIGFWMRWNHWTGFPGTYFGLELGDGSNLVFEESPMESVESVHEPFSPCSVVEWIEKISQDHLTEDYPSFKRYYPDVELSFNTIEHVSKPTDGTCVKSFTPRTDAFTGYWKDISNGYQLSKSSLVENLVKRGIDISMIETAPTPISTLLMNPIALCRPDPPTTWSEPLLRLVGRDDICVLLNQTDDPVYVNQYRPAEHSMASGLDIRSICQRITSEQSTAMNSEDRSISHLAKLIYRIDRRWNDITELLDPLRVAVAEIKQTPGTTEAQFLEEQKEFAQRVYKRTMAIPSGQGLLTYSRRRPLPTEKLAVESFNTSCLMQPSNTTVNADRSNFTEEKVCWAFFHAGVRTGLSQARDAKSIDTSWLVLNKPPELGNRHAGLLLGLGLNGHLKSMAKWLAFKYLTPKHNMTSIGLLLGLSASYIGTMNSLVTRLLTVHVTRLLPPGAAELNLSPLTQTAGVMGIGLLYYNTQHRRMSDVMLSEIENIETEDTSVRPDFRDEGYRLAAGFALGLINLGQGSNLNALHDLNVADRLLAVATGPREVQTVHVLDQATAGATIAITLLFMKSHDTNIARRIDVPQTLQQFDYSRPDILLLRVVARNLIMWDEIKGSLQWIHDRLPSEYRQSLDPALILAINNALSTRWLPLYNILGGLCWSMSLKFAGSGSTDARDCLFYFFDEITLFLQLPHNTYDQMLTRDTLLRFQHLLALSFATIMAGTGDLDCLRRLRVLYATVRADSTFGFHQAANTALGILFVGQGRYTFSTSNLAIASLLCAFYPLFPRDVLDNKAHLQAFRHMWTFATEARCLITRDVETNKPIVTPVCIFLRDGTVKDFSAPCLLPDPSLISQIKTTSPEYWEITLDFVKNPAHLEAFRKHQTLFLSRKSLLAQHKSPFAMTVATRNIPTSSAPNSGNPCDWLFDLPAFKAMKIGPVEAASIFPHGFSSGDAAENGQPSLPESSEARGKQASGSSAEASREGMAAYDAEAEAPAPLATMLDARTTAIDDTLALAQSVKSNDYSSLVGLRMLLSWADRQRERGEEMGWVSSESMDSLKAMLFARATRESQQQQQQQRSSAVTAEEYDDADMLVD